MNMTETNSAGATALRAALAKRSAKAVMGVLDGLAGPAMAEALSQAGFSVPASSIKAGRQAIFQAVKEDLQSALQQGVDGHGLAKARTRAAAGLESPLQGLKAGISAVGHVRAVFGADKVVVSPLGDASLGDRAALQMVAAEGLMKGVLGFGVEGVPGKFELQATLGDLVDLHGRAAKAFAEVATRSALVSWSKGEPVGELGQWVPDSVQRLLLGAVSVESAQRVVSSLGSDLVGEFAFDQGQRVATALLADKGLDASAPSVEGQAEQLGLRLKEPDRMRGQYFGAVVGQDHRASLFKVNRAEAIVLTISEMDGQRPALGSSVRIGFKAGALSIAQKSVERAGPAR